MQSTTNTSTDERAPLLRDAEIRAVINDGEQEPRTADGNLEELGSVRLGVVFSSIWVG